MPPEATVERVGDGNPTFAGSPAAIGDHVRRRRLPSLAATSLAGHTLPHSRELTDALARPRSEQLDSDDVGDLARLVDHALARALERSGLERSARCIKIGHYELAAALAGRATERTPGAFRWNAATARRTIGLAAVRACVERRATSPADAVGLVMSDPYGPDGVKSAGAASCADWIIGLARPARSVVQAESVTWATRLWTAVDWHRPDVVPEVGPPDRWWRHRRPVRVAMRGRCDVRFRTPAGPALLTMLGGTPAPEDRLALCVAALVDALAHPQDVPARVAGWWPDCGRAWFVEVDTRTLASTATAVVTVVGQLAQEAVGPPGAPRA